MVIGGLKPSGALSIVMRYWGRLSPVRPCRTITFSLKYSTSSEFPAIDIYVERLAAKFTLAGVPDDYKEIVATVAGEDNGDIGGTLTPEAGTKLYVKFDKWGLTGTEKKSHLSKNLDGFTATTDFGFDWNDPAYHRSFWGKSVSYNSATPDLNIVTDREVKAAIKDPAYSMECTNIPNFRCSCRLF